jgi:hypothetical protein
LKRLVNGPTLVWNKVLAQELSKFSIHPLLGW